MGDPLHFREVHMKVSSRHKRFQVVPTGRCYYSGVYHRLAIPIVLQALCSSYLVRKTYQSQASLFPFVASLLRRILVPSTLECIYSLCPPGTFDIPKLGIGGRSLILMGSSSLSCLCLFLCRVEAVRVETAMALWIPLQKHHIRAIVFKA